MVILRPVLLETVTIGQRVARCRKARGMSQEVLAHLLGRSHSWLTKVERGERQLDRMSTIREVARVLRVDVAELIGRPDRPGIGPLHPRGPAGRDFCSCDAGGPGSGPVPLPVLTPIPPEGPGERPAPPLALLRLRSATAAYLAILRTTLPALETMAAYADPPELRLTPDVATPIQDLAEAVRAALGVDDAPGTPAAIERLVRAAVAEVEAAVRGGS